MKKAEHLEFELMLRISLAGGRRLGPGKIRLIEEIAKHGSISAAGRALNMSYKRAWDLVTEVNDLCGEPLVESKAGGKQGGGAIVTEFGKKLVVAYRNVERKTAELVSEELVAHFGKPPVHSKRRPVA